MQVTRHPASRGLYWLSEGWRILRMQPMILVSLTIIMLLVMIIPMGIPGIGPLISLTLVPAVYVGLMHAIRACERGEMPNPAMLFAAFRQDTRSALQPLLLLGVMNAALTIAARLLATVFAPDVPVLDNSEEISEMAAKGLAMFWPTLLFVLFYAPVQMAFWYAPLMIAWHDEPVGKSVFFSLVAVWRNKWAFSVMFVTWFVIAIAVIVVLRLLASALGFNPSLQSLIMLMVMFFGLASLQCSFWVTYRDVIH